MTRKILIVDPVAGRREMICDVLKGEHEVHALADGRAAVETLAKGSFDVVVCAFDAGSVSGREVLSAARQQESRPHFIMVVKDEKQAVEALQRVPLPEGRTAEGADDCLHSARNWAINIEDLREKVKKAGPHDETPAAVTAPRLAPAVSPAQDVEIRLTGSWVLKVDLLQGSVQLKKG